MDNNKKLVLLVGLILIGLGVYKFYPRCEQPSQAEIYLSQMQCIQQIATPGLKSEMCQFLKRGSECDIYETDRPALQDFLIEKVNKCTKETLEKENFCTDKLGSV